jgi:hypothetical protein
MVPRSHAVFLSHSVLALKSLSERLQAHQRRSNGVCSEKRLKAVTSYVKGSRMEARDRETTSTKKLVRLFGFLHSRLGVVYLMIDNEDYWIDTAQGRLDSAREIIRSREGDIKGLALNPRVMGLSVENDHAER